MTTMTEVQARLDEADRYLTNALVCARELTDRDFAEDIDLKCQQTA